MVAVCARQVVVVYRNDCMEISLGRLNFSSLWQVVTLYYRGGRLSRFDGSSAELVKVFIQCVLSCIAERVYLQLRYRIFVYIFNITILNFN